MTRTGSSCRRYKILPGLRVPKQTRFNQRQRKEKIVKKKINQSVITSFVNLNSQVLIHSSQTESLNSQTREDKDFESLLYDNEYNVNEEPQENQQEIEKALLEIIEENSHSQLDKPDKVEISCALLAIFFSGRMTQHALSLVMMLVKILEKDDELPKSFDELVKTILTINKNAIDYNKKMYCIICKKFFIVDKDEIKHLAPEEKKEIRFKRKCDICNERFELIIKRYMN
jgi:hypothetical protein